MAESSRRPPQWTLVSLLVVVIVMALLVCLAMPATRRAKREENERGASAMMKTLATAEADFRSNDRDNDRAQNFWVYDVSGLYTLCPSTNGMSVPTAEPGRMLALIDRRLAAADVTDIVRDAPGTVPAAKAFGAWTPLGGYLYRAFAMHEPGAPAGFGGDGGDVHPAGTVLRYARPGGIEAWGDGWNFGKFGFAALPGRSDVGSQVFIMDESITIFRFTIDGTYEATYDHSGSRARFAWQGVSMFGRPFTSATPFPSPPFVDRKE